MVSRILDPQRDLSRSRVQAEGRPILRQADHRIGSADDGNEREENEGSFHELMTALRRAQNKNLNLILMLDGHVLPSLNMIGVNAGISDRNSKNAWPRIHLCRRLCAGNLVC